MTTNKERNNIEKSKKKINEKQQKLVKVINGTTYEVLFHFDSKSQEGIYDKIIRLIKQEKI